MSNPTEQPAFNWDGELSQLTDEQLEKRHVALSRYIAAGLVLRGRDMREREGTERATPTELWEETHDELARRAWRKPNPLSTAAGQMVTPDEFQAWYGTLVNGSQ